MRDKGLSRALERAQTYMYSAKLTMYCVHSVNPATISSPPTMFIPIRDPFVIFGFILLCSQVVVALSLLCVTQRRSAREVWDAIRPSGKHADDIESAEFANDTDSLMTVPLCGHPPHNVPNESLPTDVPPAKTVRFSAKVEHFSPMTATTETFDDVFERWPRPKPYELEAGPNNRQSTSERQSIELHLNAT